jgi:hypothetical protein
VPGGEPLTSSPPFEPTDSHGPKPRTQRYPTQRPAGSNGPGHAPGVRVSSRGDGLPKDELYCTLRPLSRATRATSINPLMPSFRRAGWWRSSLARFFRGQVAPSLDHHGEHEPTDVVSPFGVLGRLIRPVVVNLGVEVRHRDAERCSLHERTRLVGLAADHQSRPQIRLGGLSGRRKASRTRASRTAIWHPFSAAIWHHAASPLKMGFQPKHAWWPWRKPPVVRAPGS